MYQIAFYVPEDFAEKVKEALFSVGVGTIGNYRRCSFQTRGEGQFEAMKGSNPFLGKVGELEKVIEIKVEMVCRKEIIQEAIEVLKKSHPYETPAYYVIELVGQ